MSTIEESVGRTVVDGVPVFHAEAPAPFVGALVFRVGSADETLDTAGYTHFVEHLALFGVGERPFPVNGFVEPARTVFYASGTRKEVTGFLTDVARSLADLPLDRVETERRVLLTEAESTPVGPMAAHLGYRFGPTGFGLANCIQFGLHKADPGALADWARRAFAAGNAAAWMTGAPPDDFSLPLLPGPRLGSPPLELLRTLRLPSHRSAGSKAVSASFLVERSSAANAALSLVARRIRRELRLSAGLSYEVGEAYMPLNGTAALGLVLADCLDEHAAIVRDRMLDTLHAFAADGPTADELAERLDELRRVSDDPRATAGFLDAMASDVLVELPPLTREDVLRLAADIDPAEAAAALRDALPSAIVVSPQWTAAPAAGFFRDDAEPTEPDAAVAGRSFRPRGVARLGPRIEIVAGDEGISFVGAEPSETVTIRWDDAVALLSWGAGRFRVAGDDFSSIDVQVGDVKDGDELEAMLRRRLADRLVPLETVDERVAIDELAAEKLGSRRFSEDDLKALPEFLLPGERVVNLATAGAGLKAGLLALTERRLLFLHGTGPIHALEIPLETVRSARCSVGVLGLGGAKLTVVAAGKQHSFFDVTPRERATEIADEIELRSAG